MFRKKFYLVLILLLTVTTGFAQSKVTETKTSLSRTSYAEKIYLQLNNTIFKTGETIWFKAIVTNATNKASKLSGVLYIDLIDFDKNIIKTKTLKLENGLSDGFFDLSNSLPSGRYLIRAYTTWNRNFGQDFIFKKHITVLDFEDFNKKEIIRNISLTETGGNQIKLSANIFPEGLKDDYKKDLKVYIQSEGILDSIEVKRKNKQYVLNYNLPQDLISVKLKVQLEDTKLKNRKRKKGSTYFKTVALDKDFVDLQFFPESGQMIDGLTSKVAYKAINYKGLGEKISGYLVDETDSIIRPFKTNDLGMGFTYFKPNKSKTYYGKIISKEGVAYKYPLPKVKSEGYLLSTGETRDYMSLTVKSNIQNTKSLYVEVRSRGVLIHNHAFMLENGMHEALIKKALIPNGIINITLFNSDDIPICERLSFNFNEEKILNIKAKTGRKSYSQRDKTALNVSVSNFDKTPIEANFSALVLDKDRLDPTQKSQPNMLSYFLLNSELKGFIENPNYYFNPNNELRKRDIEALMLTQGWRKYVYDKNDTNTDFDFKPETDKLLTGRVRSVFNKDKIPKKSVHVTMITKPSFGTQTQVTDSLGKFTFSLNNYFADKLDILIQSMNKKGVPKNYSIILDAPITSPKVDYKTKETVALADTIYRTFIEENIVQHETNKSFKISSETVALDEVELTGYNLTPEREKILKLHGTPDVVIENETLEKEEEGWMSGLYALLLAKFPDDIAFKSVKYMEDLIGIPPDTLGMGFERAWTFEAAHVVNSDFTLVYIDGEVVSGLDYEFLPYLPVRSVKSVEILRRPKGRFVEYLKEAYPRLNPFERDRAANMSNIAVLSIYTYGSNGISALTPTKGIYKGRASGYSETREFYTPKYDNLEEMDWNTSDIRSTIHWTPSVQTNKRGSSKVEFYNGDNTGDMLVVVEAITPDGKIGYFETTYTVEEENEK